LRKIISSISPSLQILKSLPRHLPPDTPGKDISNSLDGLGFNIISMNEAIDDQSKSTKWTNPLGKPPFIPCYLNKNCKISRDIQAK
jgi:hypothetical protein